MKLFSVAVVLAAIASTDVVNATLGKACVDSVLVKVFNALNEIRKLGATQTYAKKYIADAGTTTLGEWKLNQNGLNPPLNNKIKVLSGQAQIDAQKALLQTIVANTTFKDKALTWSEGLALGSADFTTEWKNDPTFKSLTTPNGSTTTSRAAANGSVTGKITETAFFYKTSSYDPQDLMFFIITNDGGASNTLANALFKSDSTYKTMGASSAHNADCTMSTVSVEVQCDAVLDVVIADGYSNSGTTTCQPTVNYGGGICDPNAYSATIFEQVQDYRANAATVYKPLLTAIAAGCDATNEMSCSYAWTAAQETAGTTSARTFTIEKTGITKAADEAVANTILEWSPGLYLTAKKQTDYLKTADSIVSSHDGSTTSSRAAEYGEGTNLVEGLFGGEDTAKNTVLMLVIDDKDSSLTFRASINNAITTMGGVSFDDHATKTSEKVGTVMLDTNFKTSSQYSACSSPATAAATTTPKGAFALVASAFSAMALSALF